MTVSTQCNYKSHLSQLLLLAIKKILPQNYEINIELMRPKQANHGDYSSNLAMQLTRYLHKNPREIATALIDALPNSPYLEKAEIAGNGFINLFLKVSAKQQFLSGVLQQGDKFGHNNLGKGKKIQIEFVSA